MIKPGLAAFATLLLVSGAALADGGKPVEAAAPAAGATADVQARCIALLAQFDKALGDAADQDRQGAKPLRETAEVDCKNPATADDGVATLVKALSELGVSPAT